MVSKTGVFNLISELIDVDGLSCLAVLAVLVRLFLRICLGVIGCIIIFWFLNMKE